MERVTEFIEEGNLLLSVAKEMIVPNQLCLKFSANIKKNTKTSWLIMKNIKYSISKAESNMT